MHAPDGRGAEFRRRLRDGARSGTVTQDASRRDGAVWINGLEIIVEDYADGCVAHRLGCKGVIVGQGDTYEEAIADVNPAIPFHLESVGQGLEH